MIIVKIWGGIGNQIFQYVFGQYLKYKYRTDVLYDDNSYLSIDKLRKRELDALDAEILYDNSCTFSKYKGVKNRVLRLFFQMLPNHHFIQEGCLLPDYIKSDHIYFFQGYWQDVKYYSWLVNNGFKINLKSKATPKELVSLCDKIRSEKDTISIHIRRGDYFSPQNVNIYGVCDTDYFIRALSIIRKSSVDSKIYVFTDDPGWVINNLHFDENVTLIPNYPISQFAYIELMSFCKHHIISNSSFSWWGAVLNNQPNSIVVAPKQWTLTSDKTIALNNWIKI